MLDNKLKISHQITLTQAEEKLSQQKAKPLFDG